MSRNVWLARGIASIMIQAVAAVATTAMSAIGRRMRYRLTPHACIATASRSAERRPRAISRPTSRLIGMVSASDEGSRVRRIRPMIGSVTPLAISFSATSMMVGICSRNVRMTSVSPNGASVSRMM